MQNRSVTVIFVLFLGLWGNSASGLGIAQTSQGFALSQQTHDILSAPIPTLTPFPTGDATSKPACSWISHELSFCNSISPGFSTASYTDQRSCLCDRSWSTTIGQFTGAVFDEEVSICADYAFTAQFSDYPKLTSLERFCSRSSQNTGTPTASISVTVPASTVGSTVPTSTAAVPTVGSGAGSSAGPIQSKKFSKSRVLTK